MTGDRYARRRLLAAAGAGLATGLAGCGYQPGAGDLDWTESYGWADGNGNPIGDRGDERWWGTTAERLVSVRNRSGRTHDFDEGWIDLEDVQVRVYDSSGDVLFTHEIEPQHRDTPVVAGGKVYLLLEDGTLAAVDVTADDDERARAWTTTDPIVPSGDDDEATEDSRNGENDDNDRTSPATIAADRDGSVVAVESGGTLACVDAETGVERFVLELEDVRSIDHLAVAGDRVWTVRDGRYLHGYDPDGTERVDQTLSDRNDREAAWLVGTGSSVVAGLAATGGGSRSLVVLSPDGDVRSSLEPSLEADSAAERSTPHPVDDRVYVHDGRSIAAVDVDAGELLWERESPFHSTDGARVVADEDGLYGYGSVARSSDSDGCPLAALSSDGEAWWTAETPAEVNCSSDLHVVGDRLVATDTGRVYGFRRTPGRRYTIL